jgi:hypothetical protein
MEVFLRGKKGRRFTLRWLNVGDNDFIINLVVESKKLIIKISEQVMDGISIPIVFDYNYRGEQYGEVQLYFSTKEISIESVNFLEPGRGFVKEIGYLTQRGTHGEFDFLIPVNQEEIDKYSAQEGMKYSIKRVNSNPTTASYHQRVELLPCKSNNFETLLRMANYPDFYLSHVEGNFKLHIKNTADKYTAIPSQAYSPACFHGLAHSVITQKYGGKSKEIFNMSELIWGDVLKELKN